MKEQENVQIVQEIYAAFQQGDIETVLKPLADDVEWWVAGSKESIPYAGTCTGREQVAQFFVTLDETVEYERFEPYEYIAQGDQVVALGRDRRRSRATNNLIENEWAMVFTLRQGKVAALRVYEDTERVALALCANPQAVASGV